MKDKTLVFLSRPNPFTAEQDIFLCRLKEVLLSNNIETVTLQAGNYDLTDTLNYLKGMIRQCYGIVIVGFKQYFIEKGWKKGNGVESSKFFNSQEIDVSGQALTSPFCQIEGTIGLLYELPLLIINEEGIREEGIVAGGKFSVKTKQFSLQKINDFFVDIDFKQQLSVWIGKVMSYYLFLSLKKT